MEEAAQILEIETFIPLLLQVKYTGSKHQIVLCSQLRLKMLDVI